MSDVFVSYARADRHRAERLVAAIEGQGFSVFWDREIQPGATWDHVLEEQLTNARSVLVLWSAESVESDWVKTEAAEAKQRHTLVPVLIDDVPIPLEFRRIQTGRLIGWSGQVDDPQFRQLLEAIASIIGREKSPPVPAPPAPAHRVPAGPDGVEKGRR